MHQMVCLSRFEIRESGSSAKKYLIEGIRSTNGFTLLTKLQTTYEQNHDFIKKKLRLRFYCFVKSRCFLQVQISLQIGYNQERSIFIRSVGANYFIICN